MRAEYLAAAAALGIDVHYVLTGQRMADEALSVDATELLNLYQPLSPPMKEAVITVVRLVAQGQSGEAPAPATAPPGQRPVLCEVQADFTVAPGKAGNGQ